MSSEPQSCRRCLYTTRHPLGLTLNAEGICSGCRIHEEKDQLNWEHRWERLEKLVRPYRSASGDHYDCIVPVTGANDSYYILHLVKDRLKLNPLLVTYNKYYNTPLGIRNLANLRIRFNCDIVIQNVNPVSVRKITRETLRRFGSIYWHCLAGQTVFPVQTAVRYQIPLILWGAHQGLEQVGMFSHDHEVEMTRRYRKDHDLMGYEADELILTANALTEADLWQYRYPEDAALAAIGVRGVYLGNYVRWDPKAQHEQMIDTYGYQGASFSRTFDTYDHVDCFNFMDLHDLLKLYKHGYSKVTDHATREIRHGRLTRAQGMDWVRKHEPANLTYMELFEDWLGVDSRGLQFILDEHRDRENWIETAPSQWRFNGHSQRWGTTQESKHPLGQEAEFQSASQLAHGEKPRYLVVGKGYPV